MKEKGWITETLGKELKTIGLKNPKRQIDYVLIRPGKRWKVIDVAVLYEPVALDNLPVVMILELLID